MLRCFMGPLAASLLLSSPAHTQPATTPAPPPPPELVLDLATTPAGPVRLAAPVTAASFWIVVANRAPALPYRVTFTGGLHSNVRDLAAGSSIYPRHEMGAPCDHLFARIFDLAESAEEENRIPERVRQLLSEGESSPCPSRQHAAQAVQLLTRDRESVTLTAGQELRVRVERLSPDRSRTVKAWEFVVAAAVPKVEWQYDSEREWLVASVVREIASAAGREESTAVVVRPLSNPDAFEVRVGGRSGYSGTVSLSPHIWAPEAYEPVARALLGRRSSRGSRPSGTGALDRLTNLQSTVLVDEAEAISRRLSDDPLDPASHEAAALVLDALALREAAGLFSDVRMLLSRASARLAIARALRGGATPSAEGEAADGVLLALVGRDLDAKAAAERLAARPEPGVEAWARAISLRATGDWRVLKEPQKATLLERLEYVRALAHGRGDEASFAFLESTSPEAVPDWARILLEGGSSVGVGNMLTPTAVSEELREAEAVRAKLLGASLPNADLFRDLNATPGTHLRATSGRGSFLDWGTWAASIQRHVACQALRRYDFLMTSLGLPDDAADLWKGLGTSLAQWRLFPLLDLQVTSRTGWSVKTRDRAAARVVYTQEHAACTAVFSTILRNPESIPAGLWSRTQARCAPDVDAGRIPSLDHWFGQALLPGTLFEVYGRLDMPATRDRFEAGGAAALQELRRLSPWDYGLAARYAARLDRKDSASLLEAYGPLADYDLRAMQDIANQIREKEPGEHVKILARICAIQMDFCFAYAHALDDVGRRDEAAGILRKAFDEARDAVSASQQAGWLVRYYMDQGDKESALAIARAAAETYSGAGLITLAELLEELGSYDEALQHFESLRDRYRSDNALNGFYVRAFLKRGDSRYKEQCSRALAALFPEGVTRASIVDFQGSPLRGVRVRDDTSLSRQLGIVAGDVIVALDGYRVDTYAQYSAIRGLTDDPSVRLVVWHEGRYFECTARLPQRRFGSTLETFGGGGFQQ